MKLYTQAEPVDRGKRNKSKFLKAPCCLQNEFQQNNYIHPHIIALGHTLHGIFQREGSNVSKTPNTSKIEVTNACNCSPDTLCTEV